MFNGLGALTKVGTVPGSITGPDGSMQYLTLPVYFSVGNLVRLLYRDSSGNILKEEYGKVSAIKSVSLSYATYVEYKIITASGTIEYIYGAAPTYDPSVFTSATSVINKGKFITIDLPSSDYSTQLSNQNSWIVSLKQTGFTHQVIINIESKLASGFIATSSEINSVRTVFVNSSKTAPTQVGISVVVGVNEQNGLPYPVIGIVAGISASGNYIAQVGTSYYEFRSGSWISNTADLEAKIADLQVKINNAKAALAAAQARLADLQSKAQALGISF